MTSVETWPADGEISDSGGGKCAQSLCSISQSPRRNFLWPNDSVQWMRSTGCPRCVPVISEAWWYQITKHSYTKPLEERLLLKILKLFFYDNRNITNQEELDFHQTRLILYKGSRSNQTQSELCARYIVTQCCCVLAYIKHGVLGVSGIMGKG